MKTQIIQLEPHDDVISARDKMGWSQTSRILLVWPERGHVLDKHLDLVMLQRHSKQLGAQLAFITRDREIRLIASELGIPVYKDLRQAQRKHWRVDRRKHPRPKYHLVIPDRPPLDLEALRMQARTHPASWMNTFPARFGFFSLGILALLSIAAVLLPAAEVQITPVTRQQQLDLLVRVNPELDSINIAGDIPAQPRSITVQGIDSMPARGSINVPDRYASTVILFTNLTANEVDLPEGIVLRNSGDNPVRFKTTKSGVLPAGPGMQVQLSAQSINPGVSGNLPSDHLTIIESALSTQVSATNPTPAQGGTDVSITAPTESQRMQLLEALTDKLTRQTLIDLEGQSSYDELPVLRSLTLTQVLDEKYSPSVGLPGDELSLELTLEYEIYTVSKDHLDDFANAILDANLEDGFLPVPGTLRVSILDQPELGLDKLARWKIRAQRGIQTIISDSSVSSMLLGITPDQALARLNSEFNFEEPPRVRLLPEWWPRMPFVSFRITIHKSGFAH